MADREKNTPLHLAGRWNRKEATLKLLTDYDCTIDVRNQDGIMAKDIGYWHDDIGAIIDDFYSEFDKAIGVTQGIDQD